jgi:hypothetical protein
MSQKPQMLDHLKVSIGFGVVLVGALVAMGRWQGQTDSALMSLAEKVMTNRNDAKELKGEVDDLQGWMVEASSHLATLDEKCAR